MQQAHEQERCWVTLLGSTCAAGATAGRAAGGAATGCGTHHSRMMPDRQLCATKLLSHHGMQAAAQHRDVAPADPDSDFDEPAPSVPQTSSAAQHGAAERGARSAHSKGKQPAAPAAEDSIAMRRTSRGAAQRARQRFQPEQLRGGLAGPYLYGPKSPAQVSSAQL